MNLQVKIFTFMLILALLPTLLFAQDNASSDLKQALDQQLQEWQAEGGSGVVFVQQKEDIIFQKGFGHADKENAKWNTVTTAFDIGSLVKEMTFVAIHQLHEQGLLDINESLDQYFDAVPEDKKNITLAQILTHTSGLQDIVDADLKPIPFTPEVDSLPVTRDELVYRTLNAPLLAVPEDDELYSNFGYGLLAVIIENTSGKPYEQYIADHLFEPAGMTKTGYLLPAYKKSDLAVGYRGKKRWGTTMDWEWFEDGPSWILRGSGGMISQVEDLSKFFRALGHGKLLGPGGLKSFYDYFSSEMKSGEHYVVSFGSNDIYEAGYFWLPERDLIILVFTNQSEHMASELIGSLWKLIRD